MLFTPSREDGNSTGEDVLAIDLAGEFLPVLDSITTTIKQIDASLEICNKLLEKSQPHKPGCIRLVWWKSNHNDQLNPVPVQLVTSRSGKWYLERMPINSMVKRAKRGGEFYETHEKTIEILSRAKELIKMREEMLGYVRKHLGLARFMSDKRMQDNLDIFKGLKAHFHLFES